MTASRPSPNLGGALIRVALVGLFVYLLHRLPSKRQIAWFLLQAGWECVKGLGRLAIEEVRRLDWDTIYKWADLAWRWLYLLYRWTDLIIKLLPYLLIFAALGSV